MGFPGGSDSKESTCNAGALDSIPGLRRSPGGRAWHPLLVFSPGESPGTEEPGRLQSMGSQRETGLSDSAQHTKNTYTQITISHISYECVYIERHKESDIDTESQTYFLGLQNYCRW